MTSGSILLAGAPGSGKSTVGRALSERLGRSFIDLDELIEARTGRTAAQLITEDGETRFRALEDEALSALVGASGAVVSLGGGALTTKRTRAAARQLGPIVRLDVPRAVLKERLHGSQQSAQRPLLAQDSIDNLLDQRERSYAAVDIVVDGLGSPNEVAERIQKRCHEASVVISRFLGESTRILVGTAISSAIAGAVAHLTPGAPVLLLLDTGVPQDIRTAIQTQIQTYFTAHLVEVPSGEESKNWSVLGHVLEDSIANGCNHRSVVVAVGGGAVCDLGNLAASLLGRGTPAILAPTSLLAQIDASVGGKCAINHAGQRNSIGAYHPPVEVITDLNFLSSLDPAEFRSGMAELIKMSIIGDANLFERLENGEPVGPEMVARAVEIKAEVVARDPTEKGDRKLLRLGHTLGKALEAASNYELRRGEAVAMGLVAAAWTSVRTQQTSADTAQRIENLIEKVGLPRRPKPELLQASHNYLIDETSMDSATHDWIAVRDIGDVMSQRLSPLELKQTLTELEG